MIERTRDLRRVKKISDANPIEEMVSFFLSISQDILYLVDRKDDVDLGVWAFEPCENGYQIHARMGKSNRGKNAVKSALNAIAWVFDHTNAHAVYAVIPTRLKRSRFLAQATGFEFRKSNHDCRFYEMTRNKFARLRI